MKNLFRTEFDYEEDDADRLEEIITNRDKYSDFTNKSTMKKIEFDYEEDPYEPEFEYEDE